jgi:hypothetical protein
MDLSYARENNISSVVADEVHAVQYQGSQHSLYLDTPVPPYFYEYVLACTADPSRVQTRTFDHRLSDITGVLLKLV